MNNQIKLSPEKYLITKANNLPFHECYINSDWNEGGLASIVISKKMPSGKIIVGMYMIDIFCLGLKNTLFKFALTELEYQDFLNEINQRYNLVICSLNTAHNIIYGGIDYAEELGFKPHEKFKFTEFLLNTDLIDNGIDNLEFGKNGKPFYCSGPFDDTKKILGILMQNIGEGNFDFLLNDNEF